MGSPLGPVLANIFVGYCEAKIDETCWPLLYNRFVDDTVPIFSSRRESRNFFDVQNYLHPALRFIAEHEVNHKLPFIDVLVNTFVRSVHRKPKLTGLYTHWKSFGPNQQKIALIKLLASGAVRICSAGKLKDEIATLKKLVSGNGYPDQVVEKTILEVNRGGNAGRINCAGAL